jgi:hypothetical protein
MAGFNKIAFRREVSPQLKNKAFPIIARRMEGFFERQKEQMITEFEAHPVTNELESFNSEQRSQFLPQGNLTALFGYEDGAEEIQKIRELLESSKITFLNQGRIAPDGSYEVTARAEAPSVALLNEETELPWQQKGLVDAVELGVSGFFRTLFGGSFTDSRSGGGIQVKNKVRDVAFSGIGRGGYLRGILSRFVARVRKGPRAK